MATAHYIKAFYEDEEVLLDGIKDLKEKGVEILDVLTPFPVHGLDKTLGYRRSWISRVGFIGGAIGATSAFYFMTWIFTKNYPLDIGGKPYFAVPSFIPITFECTVLFAAISMVTMFLLRSWVLPGVRPHIYDERITDDHFVVVVGVGKDPTDADVAAISKHLSEAGAQGITPKNDIKVKKAY